MKKVLLDLGMPDTKRGVHEYIAEEMGFPEYYGHNLDALYDMLTSVTAPTAIGIFPPAPFMDDLDIDLMVYISKVCDVFRQAEEDNPEIAVIFGEITDNREYGDAGDYDPDGDFLA